MGVDDSTERSPAGGIGPARLRPVKRMKSVRKVWGSTRRPGCHNHDGAIRWFEASFPTGQRHPHGAMEAECRPCPAQGDPSPAPRVTPLSDHGSGGPTPAVPLLSHTYLSQKIPVLPSLRPAGAAQAPISR